MIQSCEKIDRSRSPERINGSKELDQKHVQTKYKTHFMKKIPHDAETSNILVGEVEFLKKTVSAFVRLSNATVIDNLTEVSIPSR